jgi:hypothetical protein
VDGSVKLWSLDRCQVVLTLVRAEGNGTAAVTALHVAEWPGMDRGRRVFVFAGHSDAILDVWDLSGKCPVIKVAVETVEKPKQEKLLRWLIGAAVWPAPFTTDARMPLVPLAIRFNVLPHSEMAELIILGLERPASRSSDGEVITFTFPFGSEGGSLNVSS